MTKEDAKEILKSWTLDRNYASEAIALNMAIEALEQESILDKIKAEIERKANSCNIIRGEDEDNWRWGQYNAYTYVLSIIDKYMKEKER